ncbi:MAG: serine protease [Pseudoprimorskyibacter sp.]|nr:serine protease [Pseudoprimorskyibacter sp.]
MIPVLALLICLVTTAADAQGLPLPLPDGEHRAWQAIGRVNIRGYNRRGMCSGTLIAPDRVLTAAHCVLRNGRVVRTRDVVFVAGWHRGTHAGAATARDIHLFAEVRGGDLTPARDLALLTLERAMDLPPLPLAQDQPPGPFALIGYLGTRPHVLSASFGCQGRWHNMLHLDCPTLPGNSGGPVLSYGAKGWAVVGVVSQSSRSGLTAARIEQLPAD